MTQAAAPGGVGTRRVTRDDIVRAGRAGSPWDYVPLGLAALRVVPQDAEVRFLLAAAYAKLGLRTAALEQLERLDGAVRADPNVVALRGAIEQLPGDRVGVDELERNVRSGVEALRTRENGVDLRGHVESWRAVASRREHFRTRFGDVVWRGPGNAEGWERLEGQREMAAALALEHEGKKGYAPPYFVEGLDAPWVFARIYDATPRSADGYAPMIVLAQADAAQFLDGMSQGDMAARLADPRVRVFIGKDAGERVAEMVRERTLAGIRAAGPAITVPSTRERIAPAPAVIVAEGIELARRTNEGLSTRVQGMYAGKDRAFWAKRFAEARDGTGEPLRVLIATSRYSTFLRHSGADLREAFERAGCDCTLFMERDDSAMNDASAELLAISEARPDLVVVPNYLRDNLGSAWGAGVANVPLVTWVQDSMAHLFKPGVGRTIGEIDFVVGHVQEVMFQKFGYPRGRCEHVPMAASTTKFHPGPVDARAASRHACEIAYVSHHSETVEGLHARRRSEAGDAASARALDELLPRILAVVDGKVEDGVVQPRLREMTVEALKKHGLPADEPNIAGAMSTYTMPIADRALRHRTLAWAAGIAARRGWRMHLYGRGWEKHPTLGRCARGELEHGEDLRACYQAARAHLHVSAHTVVHQRVFECAMSGGLPVCRLQADDLSTLEYLAAAHACRLEPPVACDAWKVLGMGYRMLAYRTDACGEGRRFAAFVREMGLGERAWAWLNGVHAERLRSSPEERVDGVGMSILDLWPRPAEVMFHDEATLERVLARAVEDDGWRREQSERLGALARERVSYKAMAGRVLAFVAEGLARGDAGGGARWYDANSGMARPGVGVGR